MRSPELSWTPPRGPTVLPTHTEGRALGGRVLPQVRAVDAVPLDELIGRGVRPEVVGSLHLGVLQGAGPHCGADGAGSPSPGESSFPSPTSRTTYFPTPPLQQLGYPRLLPAKEGPAQEPEIERQGPVLKVGGWSGARQALRR